jgi:hypothetical protein
VRKLPHRVRKLPHRVRKLPHRVRKLPHRVRNLLLLSIANARCLYMQEEEVEAVREVATAASERALPLYARGAICKRRRLRQCVR